MNKKEYQTLPIDHFIYQTYPKEAPGWLEGIYHPRTPSYQKTPLPVSFQPKVSYLPNYTLLTTQSWREIESSGYGVYTYENTPLFFLTPENGNYQITITLDNPSSTPYSCYIRANQILKAESLTILPKTEQTLSFYVPVYQNQLTIAVLFGNYSALDTTPTEGTVYLSSLIIEKIEPKTAKDQPTIFLVSDSTVQTYESIYYPQTGWGQVLCQFFTNQTHIVESNCTTCSYPQARVYQTESITIENRSIGGRSSRSFLEEGKLDSTLQSLHPGDFLFVQWGHNDATAIRPNRYVSVSDFPTYLLPYYQACLMTGAQLVLITPVARRNCDEQGSFQISFPAYREQMIAFAKKYKIPLLDLGKSSTEFLTHLTPEESKSLYLWLAPGQYPDGAYPDGLSDNTHLQRYGATIFANLLVTLIRDYTEDSKLDRLKSIIHPVDPSIIPKPPRFEGIPAPCDPTMVTGFAVQEITKDGITGNFLLSFHNVKDAVSYHIYQKEKNDLTYHKIKTISQEEKNHSATLPFSAKCGFLYQYYVTAVFSNGSEGRSSRIIEVNLI